MKKLMSFLFSPSADDEEKAKNPDAKNLKAPEKMSNGMHSALQKRLDDYEAFFAEYIQFMKIYQKNQNAMQVLDEYTDYTKRYTRAMAELKAIGLEKLTDEEMIYYTEVMSRIAEELARAGI
jgi:hypothetical protein